ncbi:MAG: agmatine/peptidylarginine deiminase [Thermoanaerobaculia bacterium]
MSTRTALAATTPRAAGLRQPAEWDLHEAVWLAWPSHQDLWGDALAPVRSAFAAFASAIADVSPSTGKPRGERLEVLAPDAENEALARSALAGFGARFHRIPFGDIWLRDTAPVFLLGPGGMRATVSFRFNGWGGKYVLEHDDGVASRVAEAAGLKVFRFPWVFEGGSVEVDGEGTCLTTRQCLLNPNRNPGMPREAIESGLEDALGCTSVLWLGDGLLNDHTDGHVDTLARFVSPGVVVCMGPTGQDDPNRKVLADVEHDLRSFRDAKGRALDVTTIPSPGLVRDAEGKPMPASYVNFYIANTTVIVPAYGVPNDGAARAGVAKLFPTRRAVSIPARHLLEGGGAFHCISQQVPA